MDFRSNTERQVNLCEVYAEPRQTIEMESHYFFKKFDLGHLTGLNRSVTEKHHTQYTELIKGHRTS